MVLGVRHDEKSPGQVRYFEGAEVRIRQERLADAHALASLIASKARHEDDWNRMPGEPLAEVGGYLFPLQCPKRQGAKADDGRQIKPIGRSTHDPGPAGSADVVLPGEALEERVERGNAGTKAAPHVFALQVVNVEHVPLSSGGDASAV